MKKVSEAHFQKVLKRQKSANSTIQKVLIRQKDAQTTLFIKFYSSISTEKVFVIFLAFITFGEDKDNKFKFI